MKKKMLLLLVGVCLLAVILVSADSSIKKKSEFVGTAHAINVLNNDLVKIMGEKPTIESVAQAQILVDQQSDSIKEKIKELRAAGRLRRNSDERVQLDEFINKQMDKIANYYENFADTGRDELESLNQLKSRYIAADFEGKPKMNLQNEILQKTELIKANYDVITEMENLMKSLQSIYMEIEKEDENV